LDVFTCIISLEGPEDEKNPDGEGFGGRGPAALVLVKKGLKLSKILQQQVKKGGDVRGGRGKQRDADDSKSSTATCCL